MRYFGIAFGPGDFAYLCALEEVRTAEPPVKLRCRFYEPGTTDQVSAEVRAAGDQGVTAIGAPMSTAADGREVRAADVELRRRGVMPLPFTDTGRALFRSLSNRGLFEPLPARESQVEGEVPDGAYRQAPVFETHPDGVFCALQGRRMPAKRHPLGVQRRIEELVADELVDEGGDFWLRRIEEIEAAAAALAAHRYAVGHACWVGDPPEGVIVLPGSRLPETFSGEGVIPPVVRAPLP